MNLVLGSCFRNTPEQSICAYAERVRALSHLATARGNRLSLISVWGDCDDDTPEKLGRVLPALRLDWTLIDRTHGLGVFGSTEHPARLRGFGYAVNGVLQATPVVADVVVYVESDLIWEADMIYRLVDQVGVMEGEPVDIVAPLCYAAGDTLYDTWGTRTTDGRRFSPHYPYWDELSFDGLNEVGSVGSCVVMCGNAARRCRCDDEALVGFSRAARGLGYLIYVDPRERIQHP